MKAKTIKAVIAKKMSDWQQSIEDESVRSLVAQNTIVTGGCIASMLLKEKVNDFDVYFRDRATALAVGKYYVAKFSPEQANGIDCKIFIENGREATDTRPADDRIRIVVKSAGIASANGAKQDYEYFEARPEAASGYVSEVMQDPGDIQDSYEATEHAALESEDEDKPKFRPVFLSTNAITLSHRVQIVLRFWGEPDQIHENYDFVHCTNYWQSWGVNSRDGGNLILRPDAMESLLARELRYVGSRYPICSLIRLRKFIKRNWTINAGQILKMAFQVSELNLTDINVLEDQLTGVDVAYFCQLVETLKEKDPAKVNAAYLIEIIDRMF